LRHSIDHIFEIVDGHLL
jgi:hypothetical protein